MNLRTLGLTAFALIALASAAFGQSSERIRFAAGNDNASAQSAIRGGEYRDYVLEAREGQRMSVSLSTDGSAYFNILPPGSDGVAIYNSSIDGNDSSLVLPATGAYRVRIYLMGADNSEGRSVRYTLSVGIS